MNDFVSTTVGWLFMGIMLLLPIGWLYWLWLAIKIGGFAMFVLALLPITTPIAAILGGWSFLFGMPDWAYSFFVN